MISTANISLIIFDLDGTVRRCKKHSTEHYNAPCHNLNNEWELILGTKEVLDKIDWTKIGFGVATNQQQIGLGISTEGQVLTEILKTIYALFPDWPLTTVIGEKVAEDRYVHYQERRRVPQYGPVYRYAPAALDASDPRSKPSCWMLLDLVLAYHERLDQTLFVGDTEKDREAAQRAGIRFWWAWQFFNRAKPL